MSHTVEYAVGALGHHHRPLLMRPEVHRVPFVQRLQPGGIVGVDLRHVGAVLRLSLD